jgi:lysyl-tRNA synthetase class 2
MWQPTADITSLQQRAAMLSAIREFFAARQVMEVDTPLISTAASTDVYLDSFSVDASYYLPTSPEFFMKRLLAAGSGPIYQICKALRRGEQGRWHNPEFTMLEWYRPGFDHHALMQEVDALLQHLLHTPPAEQFTYQALFMRYLSVDPHSASTDGLQQQLQQHSVPLPENLDKQDKDVLLQLLMSEVIEPQLVQLPVVMVYDYPASQAMLARVRPGAPALAERFEVYVRGIELANGFHELSNAAEQQQRFLQDLATRKRLGYPSVPMDKKLLAALQHGLPDCAGVALGIERLLMLALGKQDITQVMAFAWESI